MGDQRKLVDPSFLDLVRYGLLGPKDRKVVSTLPVIDRELRVSTANGPSESLVRKPGP